MSKSLKSVLFIDNAGGSYLPQAITLSRSFARMLYHIPYQSPFPIPLNDAIGSGIDGIEVVNNIYDKLNDFDLVIIPDIYLQSIGNSLRKLGKPVFGGQMDDLEVYRDKFYEICERLDMDVIPYSVIKGFKAFRKYIRKQTSIGVYVKINYWRGIAETFRVENSNHIEPLLEQIKYKLGPLAEDVTFIVQQEHKGDIVELGYDGAVINGEYIDGIFGIEKKNSAYIGAHMDFPEPIVRTNAQFKPALAGKTGFYSTEVRFDTKTNKAFYNDGCFRMGMPPSNCYLCPNLITNWSDIICEGAIGTLVQPIYKDKYVCEIVLKSSWVNENFLSVTFPEEFRDNIKLKGSFIRNGQTYIVPMKQTANFEMSEIGSVVVSGDDPQQIMLKAKMIAEQVEGFDITFEDNAIEKINEEIVMLKDKIGLVF